jgi:uncharacterized protein (TIGR00369 family)
MPSRIANRAYGTVSADQQKAMTGLEFVRGLADGTLPLNTIAETLGYDIAEAESGRVVVTAEPKDIHLNPAGTVHGGLAATMLDSAMGLAIRSTLEKGVGSTTLEFKISSSRYHSCGRSRRRPADQGRGHGDQSRPPGRHRGRARHRRQGAPARARHNHLPDFRQLIRRRAKLAAAAGVPLLLVWQRPHPPGGRSLSPLRAFEPCRRALPRRSPAAEVRRLWRATCVYRFVRP